MTLSRRFIDWSNRFGPTKTAPVMVIETFERDTVIHFGNIYEKIKRDPLMSPTRGKISSFTYKSQKRARLVLRNIASKMECEFGLTYPEAFPSYGKVCKRHLKALVEWFRRRNIRVFWVIEFQKRGAPHFHGMADKHVSFDELSRAWYRIVNSGDEKHLVHGVHVAPIRSSRSIASYYTKYLQKLEQKTVPQGFEGIGRFWGYTRSLLQRKITSVAGNLRGMFSEIRTLRRWYAAKWRSVGFRWKWKGGGLTLWDLGEDERRNILEKTGSAVLALCDDRARYG